VTDEDFLVAIDQAGIVTSLEEWLSEVMSEAGSAVDLGRIDLDTQNGQPTASFKAPVKGTFQVQGTPDLNRRFMMQKLLYLQADETIQLPLTGYYDAYFLRIAAATPDGSSESNAPAEPEP
jgi:hypothetical protein